MTIESFVNVTVANEGDEDANLWVACIWIAGQVIATFDSRENRAKAEEKAIDFCKKQNWIII